MGEVTHACPGVPILLVGLKSDTRENGVRKPLQSVTGFEAYASASDIGAKNYIECSALTGRGMNEVFEAATRSCLKTSGRSEKSSRCTVL